MTSILPSITARVISAQIPRGFSGKGYVEKAGADGIFVIALSTGKISVQSEPDSLSEGDVVLVKANGGDLLIEKMPGQSAPLPMRCASDALELRARQPAESATNAPESVRSAASSGRGAAAGAIAAVALAGPRLPAEGFYYFDTLDDALSWLSDFSPEPGDVRRMIPEELMRSPVVLHVAATENQGMRALVLTPEAAEARLAFFVRERLQSGLWEEYFPGGLLPLLRERGSLSSERLAAIDTLLPGYGGSAENTPVPETDAASGQPRSMGRTGARDLINQWLTIALEETAPLSVLARQSPLPSAAGLPPLVEEIRRSRTGPAALSHSPDIRDFSLEASAFNDPAAKAGIVPRILERLGIDHERTIMDKAHYDPEPPGEVPNLKQSLLTFDRDLENIMTRSLGEASESPLRQTYRACRSMAEIWESGYGRLMHELSTLSTSPSHEQEAQGDAALMLKYPQAVQEKIASLMKTIISEVSRAAETIREAVAQFRAAQESNLKTTHLPVADAAAYKKAAEIEGLVQTAISRIKTAFGDIAGKIEAALQSLGTQRTDLFKAQQAPPFSGGAQAASAQSPAPPERPPGRISGTMDEVAVQALRQVRALSGLIDRVAAQSSNMLDDANRDNAASRNSTSPEVVRRLVETALQHIESLQVSAKPSSTGDVRQQVVMVPMNIDGQWSDVIVKFVRDDNREKKKGPKKNIAVSINVAPVFLGEVTVAMDYKGKDLSVRMNIDKDRTLSWFKNNQQGLVDALADLGFKNPHMTIQKNSRPVPSAVIGGAKASKAAIDIMV